MGEDREGVLVRIVGALRGIGGYESREHASHALESLVSEIGSRLAGVCNGEHGVTSLASGGRVDDREIYVATVKCGDHVFEIHVELAEAKVYTARFMGVRL
jgi:hypothetical protein